MISELGKKARKASLVLSSASDEQKNAALVKAAETIRNRQDIILVENAKDIENAKAKDYPSAFIDRLLLTEKRIADISDGIIKITSLEDPVGIILEENIRPNGLKIVKKTVPLGVIGVIFESRPNVSADSAALCIKSGNAVILRGGKEAINSNAAIVGAIRDAISEAGLPSDCVQIIEDTTRASATELMHADGYIDVLIPRGGPGLIKAIKKEASVPVIETGAGTCHTYINYDADIDMAVDIVVNAKTSRPSVCNALECLLVNERIADKALPRIYDALKQKGVVIRGDEKAKDILPEIESATEDDWGYEYDDLILALRTVSSTDEAISYINEYGTNHSDCIITEDPTEAEMFMQKVDSAAVYWNASTRFTDGGEFGFGAEIGISTQKLHARGPLGLKELCSYKYLIYGKGQIR